MRDVKQLLRNLSAIINAHGNKHEKEVARGIRDNILKKYKDIDFIDEITVEWIHYFRTKNERALWHYAAKANNIKIFKLTNSTKLMSEGDEVNMIIAKSEWQFAMRQFKKIEREAKRAIVNKLWSKLCSDGGAKSAQTWDDTLCASLLDNMDSYKKQLIN